VLIRERLAAGISVLWVTHDAQQGVRMATRALRVEAGDVRECPL
jgi:ABC-type iron transport system FetAB ATPase subunit